MACPNERHCEYALLTNIIRNLELSNRARSSREQQMRQQLQTTRAMLGMGGTTPCWPPPPMSEDDTSSSCVCDTDDTDTDDEGCCPYKVYDISIDVTPSASEASSLGSLQGEDIAYLQQMQAITYDEIKRLKHRERDIMRTAQRTRDVVEQLVCMLCEAPRGCPSGQAPAATPAPPPPTPPPTFQPEHASLAGQSLTETTRRLSCMVQHSKECSQCEQTIQDSLKSIDEELNVLAEEFRQTHYETPRGFPKQTASQLDTTDTEAAAEEGLIEEIPATGGEEAALPIVPGEGEGGEAPDMDDVFYEALETAVELSEGNKEVPTEEVPPPVEEVPPPVEEVPTEEVPPPVEEVPTEEVPPLVEEVAPPVEEVPPPVEEVPTEEVPPPVEEVPPPVEVPTEEVPLSKGSTQSVKAEPPEPAPAAPTEEDAVLVLLQQMLLDQTAQIRMLAEVVKQLAVANHPPPCVCQPCRGGARAAGDQWLSAAPDLRPPRRLRHLQNAGDSGLAQETFYKYPRV